MEEKNGEKRFALLIFGFIAAAFGGWLYEEACVWILYRHLYNRGMLHLTICPIYGFGAWGMYLMLRKVKPAWLYFTLSVIIASVFEYACACLLEAIFHHRYWSYADWPFSVRDRISLISSLIFGLLSVLFARGVLPLLQRCMKKGRAAVWNAAAIVSLCVIAGDFLLVLNGMHTG